MAVSWVHFPASVFIPVTGGVLGGVVTFSLDHGSMMFHVSFSVAGSVGFRASLFPSMSSVMVVPTLIKLWAPFFY